MVYLYEIANYQFKNPKLMKSVTLILMMLFYSIVLMGQSITGKVADASGQSLPSVSVLVKGTLVGTTTDSNGNFTLTLPSGAKTLVFSFIGMETKEVAIGTTTNYSVVLIESSIGLEEVIIVGYGQQKKESIVGAITQTTYETIARSGGVSTLGQALTGQLPGVITIVGSGEPGANDPRILIRGQSTWNNTQPLILVDGIEREMNDIDISEVKSISVLKDASATAVFGVKGASGVILVTTKRGQTGKASLQFSENTSFKTISRLPRKFGSYEALAFRNRAIEHELSVRDLGWGYYTPVSTLNRYKSPQAPGDEYIFPNVDWIDEMTKDFGLSYHANMNVTGGTDFAKYFGSFTYTHEGDILNTGLETGKPYKSSFAYNRFNYRTNLDFNLTPTTALAVNLSGYLGIKSDCYNVSDVDVWRGFNENPPNAFPIKHADGTWGYTTLSQIFNVIELLNNTGVEKNMRSQVSTDFILKQNLNFITQGLSLQGSLSYDNRFYSSGGINEGQGSALRKYISPNIIDMKPGETEADYTSYDPATGTNDFDWVPSPVNYVAESMSTGSAYRRLFYQFQVNYARRFGKHDLGTTLLINRENYAEGSMFPRYREDWVGRITYNYDGRYLFESNGAYNGSEKFGKGYRFGFFPSVAVGWMLSNESFLKFPWLDRLKLRYSIGLVGNDNYSSSRWAYETNWALDSPTPYFGYPISALSPYTQYKESVIGNPNLHWEVAKKQNFGIELAVFKMFTVNVELFKDDRNDIFLASGSRNVPSYFGATPVAANLGKTSTTGYEFEFKFKNSARNKIHYYVDWNFAHAEDKIIFKEDPVLMPDYQKAAGFQIDQTRSQLYDGYVDNWDEVYATVKLSSANDQKLPGDLFVIDFNGDGQINNFDNAPYGYPTRPQNTYSVTTGADYKGFSAMIQFYGVSNVSQSVGLALFGSGIYSTVFEGKDDVWTPDNTENARWKAARLQSSSQSASQNYYDASYLRLKTVNLAYTFDKRLFKKLGDTSIKIYVDGNNLLFWSDVPEDREGNVGNPYPTYKRYNFGVNVNF